MGNRRVAREMALKILFQVDLVHCNVNEASSYTFQIEDLLQCNDSDSIISFSQDLVKGVLANLNEIDALIRKHANNWSLERMANIDRNILRIAIYEIVFIDNIPKSVSINEAVELAKKYSTENSFGFVNGVLGKVEKNDN
ncbi:MAG: transcription antitermination factor NusB [Atribacterota bacterium]|nr:transcription antitermination factor NusB [Atribacterota bacterium]MDD4896282.1 transcription antitermination factor NusB [Atribacterota bacterium]MDD5636235.1 transcription antitermination factor NusB [Atribacterota bacterium]